MSIVLCDSRGRAIKHFMRIFACVFLGVLSASAIAQPPINSEIASLIDQVKKKAELKLDPMTVEVAIDTEAFELQRLSDPALVASISAQGADALAAGQLEKAKKGFSNLRFTFSEQAVDATIAYKGTVSVPALAPVDVDAQLHVRLTPAIELATDRPTAEFKIRFAVAALDISSLAMSRNGQPLSVLETGLVDALALALLLPAENLLNHIEVRAPTVVASKIDIHPVTAPGYSLSFDPKTLSPGLQIVAAVFLIDQGRLTILAQDVPPSNATPTRRANVPFQTFREEFLRTLGGTGASWVDQGQLSAFVKTDVVQRLTSKLLADGPLCMEAKAIDHNVHIHTTLALPPESGIDCTPDKDCNQTNDCNQTEDCAQRAACGDVCTFRAPITGHCITHGHDLGCEAGKVARKAACEAGKGSRRATCEAEKTAKKGACEALKTTGKGLCEGLKEAYKRLRGTGPDYANVSSDDLRLNGMARVCLDAIKLESVALHLTGKLQAEGTVGVHGKITFTPLNFLGQVLCFAPFDYSLSETVRMAPQSFDIDSHAQLQADGKSLTVTASISTPVHLQFPFRDIATKLAADPKFRITCPIPGVATQLRVLTPDQWWPQLARGELDKGFPTFNFGIDLFARPEKVDGLSLSGTLQRTEAGVGGAFEMVTDGTVR